MYTVTGGKAFELDNYFEQDAPSIEAAQSLALSEARKVAETYGTEVRGPWQDELGNYYSVDDSTGPGSHIWRWAPSA